MNIPEESAQERIDRLIGEVRRHNLIFNLIYVWPSVVVLLTLVIGSLFDPKQLWVQIVVWSGQALFFFIIALITLLGTGYPKFLCRFLFGPERELSDTEKAEKTRLDEITKTLKN
jgi:hypothetical protein